MNRNEKTVVEDYHRSGHDKAERPEMIEVFISVSYYTIDDQPNWLPSFNARKSIVESTKILDGSSRPIYKTTGGADEVEELWYEGVWPKYMGCPLPKFGDEQEFQKVRPDKIFDYPADLITELKKYENDPRTKKFVCGTGKFWIESSRKHNISDISDPFPDCEEISAMVMFFNDMEEAKAWVNEVLSNVKGFTPEQIQSNADRYVEPVYSDEEEEDSMMITNLKKIVHFVAKNAEYFCKKENKAKLEWVMYRFSNLFYAARLVGQGYEDSIRYFLESFDWSDGLTEEQAESIEYATISYRKLEDYGYVKKVFPRSLPVLSMEDIAQIENGDLPESVQLIVKKNKTLDDHIRISQLVYGKNIHDASGDLYLTYYGGLTFKDGYMDQTSFTEVTPDFVHAWRGIAEEQDEQILNGINEILNDKDVIECQNSANLIYKDNYVKDCLDQWLDKKIPKAAKEKMEKFNYDQWVHFTSKVLDTGYEEEKKKRKEEYKLILGIDPLIFKVDKNSHPSYIKAAIEIANKAIASSHTSEKDLIKMKNVLKTLS